MNLKSIGFNIQQERKKQGLTQEKLSELAGCNLRYLQAVEEGYQIASVKWLNNIAEKMTVPLENFFNDSIPHQ